MLLILLLHTYYTYDLLLHTYYIYYLLIPYLDGIKCVIPMLALDNEIVRVYVLKLALYLFIDYDD